jgi:hypothetical protein
VDESPGPFSATSWRGPWWLGINGPGVSTISGQSIGDGALLEIATQFFAHGAYVARVHHQF